jgi:hypothetical protein
MVEGFAEGKIVALHYRLSYYCPTMPSSDLDGPFGRGDGRPEAEDPEEYQHPPCVLGDTGTGSLPDVGPDGRPFGQVAKFYGIGPNFRGSLGFANTPGNVESQCSQPGLPYTQYKGRLGTCLMHPSLVRVARTDDSTHQFPDPVPLPQHSHLMEATSSPAQWWNTVAVFIDDPSVWPDNNGNCPAGPPNCVTSVAALRAAQRRGQASRDFPTNLFVYFSVIPEANQPAAGSASPAAVSGSAYRAGVSACRLAPLT